MTCREEEVEGVHGTWKQTYNEENRLWKIEKISGTCASQGSATLRWTNTYDGGGVRVQQDYWNGSITTTTLYFMRGMYESQDSGGGGEKTLVYYNIGSFMVAMDDGTDLVYFASDNLSSASLVMDDSGTLLSENRYMPFGEVRTISGVTNITETDFGFTGQRNNSYIKLLDYKARSYSPYLNRFIQPDSIIPNLYTPQSLNRFSYALNNPVKYNDPSGHMECGEYGCNGDGNGGWIDNPYRKKHRRPGGFKGENTSRQPGNIDKDLTGDDQSGGEDGTIQVSPGPSLNSSIVVFPPGTQPHEPERSDFEHGAGEILHVVGFFMDVLEMLAIGIPVDLTGLETGLGIADVGFTYSACVLVGDCYIGQPHPDLPEMLVIGQDVIVTSSDVVLPLLGLGGGGPAGQALTDAITTMFSGAYDANRIWNDAPTHMAIGVTGDINFENNVLTVDADHKFILIYP